MVPDRPHLFGLRPDDLVAELAKRGVACPIGDARRLIAHVVAGGRSDLEPRSSISRVVRLAVAEHFDHAPLILVERVRDDFDGFEKYLFRHPDGALSEAVRIPLKKPGAYSVCLSTQVGCAMKCVFCATGSLGLKRQLAAWEIIAAWRQIRDDLRREQPTARVSSAVFMGQGEPFHNYDAVMQAAAVLSDPCGGQISAPAITMSTVGLVPQIRRFAAEKRPYKLIVSLHSAVPERRLALLPVAGRTSFADLKDALIEAHAVGGDRVVLGWCLIGGVNHDDVEIEALKREFEGLPIRVNVIDLNRWDERDGRRRATDDERKAFIAGLHAAGIATIRRYSGGQNKHAACGMLAATRQEPETAAIPGA